jgi:hypothetical protein
VEQNYEIRAKSRASAATPLLEDPLGFVGPSEANHRNFLVILFRMYSELPFDSCLSNFAKVYNDVFIKEVSNV